MGGIVNICGAKGLTYGYRQDQWVIQGNPFLKKFHPCKFSQRAMEEGQNVDLVNTR